MFFTALPFPDQKFKKAVHNGDEFGALLTFFTKNLIVLITNCYLQNFVGLEYQIGHSVLVFHIFTDELNELK